MILPCILEKILEESRDNAKFRCLLLEILQPCDVSLILILVDILWQLNFLACSRGPFIKTIFDLNGQISEKMLQSSKKDVPQSKRRQVLQETACRHRRTQDGQHRRPLHLGTMHCWWQFVWAGPYTSLFSPQDPRTKMRMRIYRAKKTDLVNKPKVLK